ncbi:hypothetical protein EDB81DRAFT_259990 [Dactylonectria macrodidyma]|uniref:Uncharacterized protein n=1 Tax=Dactylonectria macrodidyma TaxID=307937 RepID=A0A9P9JJW7_9HYPO|nr:hypothetical protein EDB81DRAFT_259990 [Dactylonectria macrodidyma]
MTEEEIQDDLQTVRKTLASVDQPALTVAKTKSHSDGGQTWAQGTIRDITSKCNEVMGASAYIPITTTTGYDLPLRTSRDHLGQGSSAGGRRRRTLSRVIHNLPNLSPPMDSAGSSQTSATLNTSSSSEPLVETPVTDTKSTSPLKRAKQRTRIYMSKGPEQLGLEAATSHPQSSMSHTSMYTAHQEGQAENFQDQDTQAANAEDMANDNYHVASSAALKETGEIGRSLLGTKTKIEKTQTTKPLVRIPGSYPEHLLARADADADADADIADPSSDESEKGGRECERESLWDWSKEVLCTTLTWVVFLTRFCWQMIRLVFDSKSEWWERNARQETTIWDCVCVALAVAVSVVSMMGFMWAIWLAKMAGACVIQGLAVAGEELMVALGI